MSKLLVKPKEEQKIDIPAKYQKFNLTENPFPSEPVVNKDSNDKRINGDIYEAEIRRREYDQIESVFLKQNLTSPNHLRLGYIMDTSYIGRGNGKSAFLINLIHRINKEYCIDISKGINKAFAAYVATEPGGRTKTFSSFVDLIFDSILRSKIIQYCLAAVRLEAIILLKPEFKIDENVDETQVVNDLNSEDWYTKNNLNITEITDLVLKNKFLQELPPMFPLFSNRNFFNFKLLEESDFEKYFRTLKKGKERLDFVFSHIVKLFMAANFNGAFILVDDFERIPDFQSTRQKRDFALELRSCLFDGFYTNAKVGFYNFLLVLHAGVPRLISEAWAESGMENRAPMSQHVASNHIIRFEKLNKAHASMLLEKYLNEYRIKAINKGDKLYPFKKDAVRKIGEISEYNAAKILKMAYDLLDKAASTDGATAIDGTFVDDNKEILQDMGDKPALSFKDKEPLDLLDKAKGEFK